MGGTRAPSFITDADLRPTEGDKQTDVQQPSDPEKEAARIKAGQAVKKGAELRAEVTEQAKKQEGTEETPKRPTYADALADAMTELDLETTGDAKKDFVEVATAYGKQIETEYGIPYQVVVAQASLESAYGQDPKHQENLMFFGIKAGSSYTGDKAVGVDTHELDDTGNLVKVKADFRAYSSMKDSFTDYAKLLSGDERYKKALEHKNDPRKFLYAVVEAGYAGKRNTPELINQYVDRAESFIKPYGMDFGPSVAQPEAEEEETEEGEKTLWGSLLAGLGSMKDTIVKWLSDLGETIKGWFGYGKEKAKEGALAVKRKAYELKDLLTSDSPVFSFPKEFPIGTALHPKITDIIRHRDSHPVTGKPAEHNGYDIAGLPEGTPIAMTTQGKVIESAFQESTDKDTGKKTGAGHFVKVELPDGKVAVFMHLREKGVEKGATLKPGSVIGEVGKTGGATGPHLHYEIRKDNKAEDPMAYLDPALQASAQEEKQKRGLA